MCTSGEASDLRRTDQIAATVLQDIIACKLARAQHSTILMRQPLLHQCSSKEFSAINNACSHTGGIPVEIGQQYEDNLRWLAEAEKHRLVVGSQARILYSDQQGRVAIAKAFNQAVAAGRVKVSRCKLVPSSLL